MGNVFVNGYELFFDEEMVKLIDQGMILVSSYELMGGTYVEIQTDMDKTTQDVWVFVDEFNTIEEANECAKQKGEYLKFTL